MSLVRPLKFVTTQGDLDAATNPIQQLPTVHRVALMPIADGRSPDTTSHFKDPSGVVSYHGFGANGQYFEGGVEQRTYRAKESIDDFADRVTDISRWVGIVGGTDFTEEGIDYVANPPFGRRCESVYAGPVGAESYDRKGSMVFTPAGNLCVLSSRVSTNGEGVPLGVNAENCVLLGLQASGDESTYLFVGYVNTATHGFSVIAGHYDAGALVVSYTVALPLAASHLSVDVAIKYDDTAGTYEGFYTLDKSGTDYTNVAWTSMGVAVAVPVSFTGNIVPRLHAEFPNGATAGESKHAIADVRVEIGSDPFVGNQQASWYVEPTDGGNPGELSGGAQDCPDKLMVMWTLDNTGANALVLLDVTGAAPVLWRRWKNLPTWSAPVHTTTPWWSPGWLDADEGHIVMTRNHPRGIESEEKGEVWLFSLRWDTVKIFDVDGLSRFSLFNTPGEILRETGTWGSRRWYPVAAPEAVVQDNYDDLHTGGFVGTMRKVGSEVVDNAMTYGVNIRRCSDGLVYLAYGIQEVPGAMPGVGDTYAGMLVLSEGTSPVFTRWLFQRDSASVDLWDATDECWVGVSVTQAKALWWQQAIKGADPDELQGSLCRKDFLAEPGDNLAAAPITEDNSWEGVDWFGGMCASMSLIDSSPVGNEVLGVASGWLGDTWGTVVRYSNAIPTDTVVETYGYITTTPQGLVVTASLPGAPPGMRFPDWVGREITVTDDVLDRCRSTNGEWRSAPVGGSSFSVPRWALYGKWTGEASATHIQSWTRGANVSRGDFVLEMKTLFWPPFNAFSRWNAHQGALTGQNFRIRLFIEGERRLFGYTEFAVLGQTGGNAIFQIEGGLDFYDVAGQQVTGLTAIPVGTNLSSPGSEVTLRIRREGRQIDFLYYEPLAGGYISVHSVTNGLQTPLKVGFQVIVDDVVAGLAASFMSEMTSFTLAPQDAPTGQEMVRPVHFPVLPNGASSVGGVAVSRMKLPTLALGGRVVVAESWPIPGWPAF